VKTLTCILLFSFPSIAFSQENLIFPGVEDLQKRVTSLESEVKRLDSLYSDLLNQVKKEREKPNEEPSKPKLIPNPTFGDYPSICTSPKRSRTITITHRRKSRPRCACPR
jgi:uncharacterized small protein (DUF1192 family)